MSTTHVAGLGLTFDAHMRQRCAWCGVVIDDKDLTRVAVQVVEGEDPRPLPQWPTGALVTVDGPVTYVNEGTPSAVHEGGVKVPDDCCMLLPPEITAGRFEAAPC